MLLSRELGHFINEFFSALLYPPHHRYQRLHLRRMAAGFESIAVTFWSAGAFAAVHTAAAIFHRWRLAGASFAGLRAAPESMIRQFQRFPPINTGEVLKGRFLRLHRAVIHFLVLTPPPL